MALSICRTIPFKYLGTKQMSSFGSGGLKVAVTGGLSDISKYLSIMLLQSGWFQEVAIHDDKNTKPFVLELSHIDSPTKVTSHSGPKGLKTCFKDANIVVIGAGVEKHEAKENQFEKNACIVVRQAKACTDFCPDACVCLMTNPVNSLVPAIMEVYRGVFRTVFPNLIMGINAMDVMRANTFIAEVLNIPPEEVTVPVVGGRSSNTVVPLLSRTNPCTDLTMDEVVKITRALQEAGDEVRRAKEGKGSAALSTAYAATKAVTSVAKGLLDRPDVIECAFVQTNIMPCVNYFATEVHFGPKGIQKVNGIPQLSGYECCLLETAVPHLQKDIEKGEQYVKKLIESGNL